MKNYVVNGKVIDITLDNGVIKKVSTEYIRNMMKGLDIDEEDAVLTWLEEEGYLVNEELEELDQIAKDNKVLKSLHRAKDLDKPKVKTSRERTVKENPTKEMIIAEIAKILPNFAQDVVIENKAKLITFRIGEDEFKIDLVQKRKKKGE